MDTDSSEYSSDSVTPLRYASLRNSELTIKERLSIFCKPSFQLRRLRNKAAILVLIWNYLCISIPFFYLKIYEESHGIEFNLPIIALGLTFSVAGWIADVRCGRYRVMYFSMWIMWAGLILVTVNNVLERAVQRYTSHIYSYLNEVLEIIIAVGLGGFQANVIQFGIDQLYDASSNEITSFILWYAWSYCSSGFVVYFMFGCTPKQYRVVGCLVMCIYLSIALSSILMFNHWLVKEPVTQNPFKLVYSVVRYAIKHKHPECRSAFTYCEDEPPSRIDFGKSKYGGPFTTEQVEDVKTFLRFTIFILIVTGICGVTFASWQSLANVSNMLTDINYHRSVSFSKCYSKEAFVEITLYSGVLVLPAYELIIHPVFHRCFEVIKTHWKLILGVILMTAEIIVLMMIETLARRNYLASNYDNSTIPCIGHGTLSASMDFRWMAVPQLLYSLSIATVSIGTIEFIASQAPYSMRGLIMGTICCMLTLCGTVGLGINILFTRRLSIWGTGIISCGFWHFLLLLVIEVLVGFMLIAMLRWYKKRKREDVLPNEHIFAERFFDRDS